MKRFDQISCLMLTAAALAMAPQYANAPHWSVAFILSSTVLWRTITFWVPSWAPSIGKVRWFGLLAIVVFVGYSASSGITVTSLISLFCATLCVKQFEVRNNRDLLVIGALVLTLVGLDASYARGQLTVFCSSAALMLLLISMVLIEDRTANARPLQHLKMVALVVMAVLPLSALLLVALPLEGVPGWGVTSPSGQSRMGMSNTMSPGQIAELSLSDETAFEGRFEAKVPDPASVYWRVMVLRKFDGVTWAIGDAAKEPTGGARALRIGADRLSYTLSVPSDFGVAVPTYGGAYKVESLDSGEKVYGSMPIMQWVVFGDAHTHRSLRVYASKAYSLGVDEAEDGHADDLYVPHSNPRAVSFAKTLRKQSVDEGDFIRRTLDLFSNENFYYTLTPGLSPGLDPVDHFLFDSKSGFCEHYASAFALLMRAGGVPARVVIGYQGVSSIAPAGDFRVSQMLAHAWTEVWLKGRGWSRVDPTSYISPSRVLPRPAAKTTGALDRMYSYTSAVFKLIGLDKVVTSSLNAPESRDRSSNTSDTARVASDAKNRPKQNWMWIVIVLVASAGVVAWYRLLRMRGSDYARARAEFLFAARLMGMPKLPSEGWAAFAGRVRLTDSTAQKKQIAELADLADLVDYAGEYDNAGRLFVESCRKLVTDLPLSLRIFLYLTRAIGICR